MSLGLVTVYIDRCVHAQLKNVVLRPKQKDKKSSLKVVDMYCVIS